MKVFAKRGILRVRLAFFVILGFLVAMPVLDAGFMNVSSWAVQVPSAVPMKATVMESIGKVVLQTAGTTEWRDAKAGDVLNSGDKIETKEGGLVEIKLENDNVINLKPGSSLMLAMLASEPASATYVNKLQLNMGKLRAVVEKMSTKSTFEIATPTAVAAVRGTIAYVSTDGTSTDAAFFDGLGYVTNPVTGQTQTVGDGETTHSDGNGLSEPQGISDAQYNEMEGGWVPGDQTQHQGPETYNANQPSEPERPEGSNYR